MNPIIQLTPDSRLDALINALQCARTRFRLSGYACPVGTGELEWVESLDAYTAAWEALHAELMNQLRKDSL